MLALFLSSSQTEPHKGKKSITIATLSELEAKMSMDAADMPSLEVSPRGSTGRRSKPWSRSSSIGRSSIGSGGSSGGSGSIEYTSLRDMLEEGGAEHTHHHHHWRGGGSWGEYSCHEIHDFDASNIGIRNQLLKHAASAYLQSAVVVAAERDQSCCLVRLWRKVQLRSGFGGGGSGSAGTGGRRGRGGRGRVLMRACSWPECMEDPAEICASFVARTARRVTAFVADRVTGIWAW
ncbi:hypothetical protein ACP4OV_023048 [Aristida adscensionis]